MSATHTPGPWIADTTYSPDCPFASARIFSAASENDDPRYPVAYVQATFLPDMNEANARLIAAAPELLEALKWAADKLNDVSEWCKAYCDPMQARSVMAIEEMARAAIAKAEGGQ